MKSFLGNKLFCLICTSCAYGDFTKSLPNLLDSLLAPSGPPSWYASTETIAPVQSVWHATVKFGRDYPVFSIHPTLLLSDQTHNSTVLWAFHFRIGRAMGTRIARDYLFWCHLISHNGHVGMPCIAGISEFDHFDKAFVSSSRMDSNFCLKSDLGELDDSHHHGDTGASNHDLERPVIDTLRVDQDVFVKISKVSNLNSERSLGHFVVYAPSFEAQNLVFVRTLHSGYLARKAYNFYYEKQIISFAERLLIGSLVKKLNSFQRIITGISAEENTCLDESVNHSVHSAVSISQLIEWLSDELGHKQSIVLGRRYEHHFYGHVYFLFQYTHTIRLAA